MATCLASHLDGAADLLQACYRDGLFSNTMKLYSPAMSSGYGMKAAESENAYRIYAFVAGGPEMVARACDLVHQDCRRSGLLGMTQFANLAELQSHDEAFAHIIDGLYKGQPGCIGHATFSASCDLDNDSDTGSCAVFPVLPLSGRSLAKVGDMVDAVARKFERHTGITCGVPDDRSVESVIATRFNRNPAERASAHQCMAGLRKRLCHEGYRPYRTNTNFFDSEKLYRSAGYIDVLQQLKRYFDPDAVISPGRYIPD